MAVNMSSMVTGMRYCEVWTRIQVNIYIDKNGGYYLGVSYYSVLATTLVEKEMTPIFLE